MIDKSRQFRWFPTTNLCKNAIGNVTLLNGDETTLYTYKQLWQEFEIVKMPTMTPKGPALMDVDQPTGNHEWREISNFPMVANPPQIEELT